MSKTKILLRDLILRLAQADVKEIYVEIEEPEQDVFVVPVAAVVGLPDLLPGTTPVVLDYQQANGIAGVDAVPLGLAGEVWEIRSVSITSNAGATYSIEDDGVIVAPGVVVGAAATGELVNVAIPVEGASAITVDAGAALDTWNLRAVRVL